MNRACHAALSAALSSSAILSLIAVLSLTALSSCRKKGKGSIAVSDCPQIEVSEPLDLTVEELIAGNTSVTVAPNALKGNKGLCELFATQPKAIQGNTLYIGISVE